jgi:nucleotide-binding universal stress UspA family protein
MKNVLLLIHDDDGQEARLQAALDLTRAMDGHLSCIDVSLFPMVTGYYYGAGAEAMLMDSELQRERANKAKLEVRLEHEDVPWDWADATGNFTDAILGAAVLADIVVLNRALDHFPFSSRGDATSSILTNVRMPVLAVPDNLSRLQLKRVLVAWDGQASIAATLRACVPLLALAEAVEIFTVRDGTEGMEPAAAASYLSRHGIHASVLTIETQTCDVDEHIKIESGNFNADYVLMGAYSRGRLVETFGGVTKRMLTTAKLPLIMGH